MALDKSDSKRARKARQTRTRMLESARDLFTEHGYGATSLKDVAQRAEVAVQTIYFTFTNKRNLLKEVVDVAIAGDEEPVATMDREWFRRALAAPTAAEQLAVHVEATGRILERVAPITVMLANASATDPEIATLWPSGEDPRYTVQLAAAANLVTKPDARADLTTAAAADLLYGLLSPELYLVFTRDRGWSVDRWRRWALPALKAEFLE